MQFYYKINDAHIRFITGIGYNPTRHELMTGSEDGVVKIWEIETGVPVASVQAHQGWVTSFLFWKFAKLMLSSSHDCTICVWQGSTVLQIVYLEDSVYKMCLDVSGNMLLCGSSTGLEFYVLDKEKLNGSFVDVETRIQMNEHTDIVRSVVVCDNRVISAGFDKKIVIYDCLYYGSEFLKVNTIVEEAHEAAITCLCVHKDHENNMWIITGGFDKCVKIWNNVGKLLHRLVSFSASIVDICIIDRSKLIWVSAGDGNPLIFDIKSGEDVTQFSNCFQKIHSERIMLQLVRYLPDTGMVVASTSRRQLLIWRWQTSSAVTRLICGTAVDCICLCEKSPILIFCAGGSGQLILWENRESNDATYQIEVAKLLKSMESAVEDKMQTRQYQLESAHSRQRQIQKNDNKLTHQPEGSKPSTTVQGVNEKKTMTRPLKSAYPDNRKSQKHDGKRKETGKRFLQILYLDSKDLLIAASEDGIIYVFGYDSAAVDALLSITKAKPPDSKWGNIKTKMQAVKAFRPSTECLLELKITVDPITMRITGLSCLRVLMEHKNVVSSITVVPPGHGREDTYLVSCSWDQRICVWNLETFELVTKFQDPKAADRDGRECAANDAISCITYCSKYDQIAYASVDMIVHIRKFHTIGAKMTLITRLSEYDGEITSILWADSLDRWIISSEDHTIRIWTSKDPFTCLQLINSGGSISTIFFDEVNETIVAAIGNEIKIFDIIEERMVQVNCGHTDDIRGLINLSYKHQFASAGDDGQLLFWNTWVRPKKYSGSKFVDDN